MIEKRFGNVHIKKATTYVLVFVQMETSTCENRCKALQLSSVASISSEKEERDAALCELKAAYMVQGETMKQQIEEVKEMLEKHKSVVTAVFGIEKEDRDAALAELRTSIMLDIDKRSTKFRR